MAGQEERMGTAWRRVEAVEIGDNKPHLVSSRLLRPPTPQTEMKEVPIRWNFILEAAIERLNGTKPAYTRERAEGFIQACVRFRIPIDNSQSVFENVEVPGMRCSEDWEAESSGPFRALIQLEHGPFHIRILDVSFLRCKEMEISCYQHLLKAGEMCRGAKLLLSDWEDTMLKSELCYKSFYEEVLEFACRGANGVYGEISCDVADSIYELNRTSYLKFAKLASEVEELKHVEWDVRNQAEHHFHGRYHSRACEKQCWDVVAQHPDKEPWNQVSNAKCERATAVADLHGACLSDLVLAKERHTFLSTWTDQHM